MLGAAVARADIIPPSGLVSGDHFRLVFVSSQTRLSDSTSFANWDAFVTALADAAGLGIYNGGVVAWHALGSISVPGQNAFDRLPNSSIPIYDINGDLIASAANDIWSGTLLHAIDYTETGVPLSTLVWTATLPNGHITPDLQGLGAFGNQVVGNSAASDSSWIDSTSAFNLNPPHSVYGYSDVITVRAAVPEPDTILLALTAAALLGFARRRRIVARANDVIQ